MRPFLIALASIALLAVGCGGGESPHGPGGPGRSGRPGGGGPPGSAGGSAAAVPVEVAAVVRRSISSFIETTGTLEAENEVDILARTEGPIVALEAEEGDRVRAGQLLARIDDEELRAELEIDRVTLAETELAWERAKTLQAEQLISPESYEQAQSAHETARARYDGTTLVLGYTEIRAPFGGLIVRRDIDFAQQVSPNQSLFRISDFDPLLCPIQVPERDLSKLRVGQRAYITVESFPDEQFDAGVLRISPVVDAATGTIKVTLAVRAIDRLRPGMFARVYVETEIRRDALVIPKAALSLESIGDTVYVAGGDTAARREVELGFREGDFVQALTGLAEGESVVVVGQDGLSDGTPIRVLEQGASMPAERVATSGPGEAGPPAGGPGARPAAEGGDGRRRGGRPDLAKMSPEQLERAKEHMRARGMTDEQIEERIRRAREQSPSTGE